MNSEDTSFLDILAAVADHEQPLAVNTASAEMDKDSDTVPTPADAELTDEDLLSLFPAHPPELPVEEQVTAEEEDDELAAIFADPPHMTSTAPKIDVSAPIPSHGPISPGIIPSATLPATAQAPTSIIASPSIPSQPTIQPPAHHIQPRGSLPGTPMTSRSSTQAPSAYASPMSTLGPGMSAPSIASPVPLPKTPAYRPSPLSGARPSPATSTPATAPVSLGPQQLLQNLLKQVPAERHPEFLELYRQLQSKMLNNDQFLDRAKGMLNVAAARQPSSPNPYTKGPLSAQTFGSPGGVGPVLDEMRKRQAEAAQYASPLGAKRMRPDSFSTPGRVSMQLNMASPLSNTVGVPVGLSPAMQYRPAAFGTPRHTVPAMSIRSADEVDPTKLDVQSMMDATSYTGVNIREEEDNIMSTVMIPSAGQYQVPGLSRVRDQSFLNIPALRKKVEAIAKDCNVSHVEADLLSYIALATQERMRDLTERMVVAAKHRTGLMHEYFLKQERERIAKGQEGLELQVVKRDDVRKKLAAIERREREEERKLKALRAATEEGQVNPEVDGADSAPVGGKVGTVGTAGASKDKEEGVKKKKKGVKEKDMPEEIKMKLANQAVMAAIGGTPLKSWMIAGTGGGNASNGAGGTSLKVGSSSKKRKFDGDGTNRSGGSVGTISSSTRLPGTAGGRRGTAAEQAMRRVTLRDALFCLEADHAMTKSPLVYKWWANVT
ncbi:hypothetical protein SpCBS45565_g00763 [Spizellomyces sp. 'palustris']|nr:hypothetical protein SpCBS45565_g00763 [Spizellomyces sp. 'palustris']